MKRLTALFLASASLVAPVPASAGADLECGSVISTDTTLDHDLIDCQTHGLIVDTPGVVLDLGGFTVDGDPLYTNGGPWEMMTGIMVTAPDVTVRNGRVQEFFQGITLSSGVVTGVTSTRNLHGISIGSDSRAIGNQVLDNKYGIAMRDRNLVEGNLSVRNDVAGIELCCRFFDGSADNIIRGNRIVDSGRFSVGEWNNPWPGYGGIFVIGPRNTVVGNTVTNAKAGGIIVQESPDSLVSGNALSGNMRGIWVQWGSPGLVVSDNVVTRSTEDGILAESSSTLTANLAIGNGDLGIEAVADVIDGGGNRAFGNGNPLQCAGVACTP